MYMYMPHVLYSKASSLRYICRTVYPVNWLKYCIGRDKVEGTPLLEKFWRISLYCTYVTDDATAKLYMTNEV